MNHLIHRAFEIYDDKGFLNLFSGILHYSSRKFGAISTFIRSELGNPHRKKVPYRWRARLLKSGFLSQAYFLYEKHDLGKYLSNYQRDFRTREINGKSERVFNDKLLFYQSFDQILDNSLAAVLGWIESGTVHHLYDYQSFQELLKDNGKVVVKPRLGGGGDDITVISMQNGSICVNSEPVSKGYLNRYLNGLTDSIVCEYVDQHNYANNIFPESLNTIRILTMYDPDLEEPFIAVAVHRFGTNDSIPTDNWSKGGIAARVDTDSGQLSKAAGVADDGTLSWYQSHPDTGVQIEGTTIPEWSSIKDQILDVAGQYPNLPYAGWDVAIDRDGEFKVIEVNSYPDVNMIQVHKPLLSDERVKRFYKHHNVI